MSVNDALRHNERGYNRARGSLMTLLDDFINGCDCDGVGKIKKVNLLALMSDLKVWRDQVAKDLEGPEEGP